jgi:N-methylhydantoinase B
MEEVGVANVHEGDVYVVNDPYRVGTHVNDVCFMRPVFYEQEVVGVLNITAHQLDFGGSVKGGFDYTKTSSYLDGLTLPPTLLFQKNEPVRSTFSLIEANTRFVDLILPDIRTIGKCLEIGDELLRETLAKYGADACFGAMRYSCDVSAEQMRVALGRLPDGMYTGSAVLDGDALPDSPEYVVNLRVRKVGQRAEFDFGGTSHAMRSALNSSWADAKTGVALAMKMLLDRESAFTSGTLRPIDTLVPPGTFLNPLPPASTHGYGNAVDAVIKAVFDAVNPAMGIHAASPDGWSSILDTAEGVDEEGKPWFVHATAGIGTLVPWGGTEEGDGDSRQKQSHLNMLESGIETTESEMPVVVVRREAVADTAGPGAHRGGAGCITDSYWPFPGRHNLFMYDAKRPTGGVNGGRTGQLGGGWLFPKVSAPVLPAILTGPIYRDAEPLVGVHNPETNELDIRGVYRTAGGPRQLVGQAVLRLVSNGAGGWGDPLTRDPSSVLRDVRDEYVSIEGAARDYGVVISGDPETDPEGLELDLSATERLRVQRAG